MVAVSLSLSLLALSSARAANQYWTNLVDGNYTNGGNWNAAAPAIADAAFFTNAGVVYTATVDSSVTNANLTFSGNGATVVLNATGNNLWSTNRLVIGAGSAGNDSTLVLSGGSFWVTNAAGGTTVIGTNANTRGTMVISNGAFTTSTLLLGGAGGSKGTLQVFGGSNTVTGTLTLGGVSGATGTVLVAGGSFNPGTMVLGSVAGSIGNSLTVSGGGNLTSSGTGFMKVGNAVGASNNLLVISGTGSTGSFASASDFAVGYQGSYNSLVVSNGGYLNTPTNVTVGWANGIVGNNSALVAGSGSVWRTATLNIGGAYFGGTGQGNSSNALVIADGGTVLSFRNEGNQGFGAVIGYGAGPQGLSTQNAYSNSVVVTGTGSLWNVSGGYLVVGLGGSRNSLVITNGGAVISASTSASSIGGQTGGSNNWVLVTGAGSVWTNAGVNLGGAPDTPSGAGFGNSLTVAQGGKVISTTAASIIGRATGANSNTVLVTGGGIWNNASTLTVGSGGVGNSLIITNGGAVVSAASAIGAASGANGNSVLVTGSGSSWTNTTIVVGGSTAGVGGGTLNTLTVAGGAMLVSTGNMSLYGGNVSAVIGGGGNASPFGNSNSVVVTGGGLWNTGPGYFYVGAGSSYNSLAITNGGIVSSGLASIGAGGSVSTSSNNTALVSGGGSVWSNSQVLLSGSQNTYTPGYFNSLTISNGGSVITVGNTSYIGYQGGGRSNVVTVTGNGSIWNSPGNLIIVGNSGGSLWNQLLVTNGGTVVSLGGTVGGLGNANSNTVIVAGSVNGTNALWNVGGGNLTVGSGNTTGNVLTVSAGGAVTNVGTLTISSSAGALGNQVNLLGGVLTTTNEIVGSTAAGATAGILIAGGTNLVLGSAAGALTIADTASTGTVVLADSGALLVATNVAPGTVGIYIGYRGVGSLIISNGTFLARDTSIGQSGSGTVGALQMFGGTATITNNLTVAGGSSGASGSLLLAGSGNPLMLVSGSMNVAYATSTLGSVTVSNGTLRLLGSTMNLAGGIGATGTFNVAGGLVLASNQAPTVVANGGHNGSGFFNISGGTSTFNQVTLFGGTTTTNAAAGVYVSGGTLNLLSKLSIGGGVSNNTATLQVSGGQLNVGSGGIVVSGGAPSATNLFLSGGTLGTLASWSSALNFVLTNNPGSGFVTFAPSLSYTNTLSGILSGNGALVKDGTGWLILSGANSYSGGTTVSNGILQLTGSGTIGSGALLVGNGGRFDGGSAPYTVNSNLTFQGQSSWNGNLNVGGSANLVITGANATIAGTLTNAGLLQVLNSQVTYSNAVVISGRYFSDPSTNVFTTNVTVTASGSMQGSNGDLFVFYKDFANLSVSNMSFSLWQAAVLFTNGAGTSNHTYNVTGSGSTDWGTGFTNFSRVSTNFAIGQLSIAAGNRLTITGQVGGGITNAVYVGWLDIQGLTLSSTDSFLHVSNTLVSALSLPDINLYYDKNDPGNAWLNEWLPDTGYNLWGGGLLLPIPEPSPFLALGAGLAVLAYLRRRKA